jgi:hypothetical protein
MINSERKASHPEPDQRSHPSSLHLPPATTAGDGRVISPPLVLTGRRARQERPNEPLHPRRLVHPKSRRPIPLLRRQQHHHHHHRPNRQIPSARGGVPAPHRDRGRRGRRGRCAGGGTGARACPAGQAKGRAFPAVDERAWTWCEHPIAHFSLIVCADAVPTGIELMMPMPMPTLRPPDEVASIAPVAMSQVSPITRGSLPNGTRPTSVRTMDLKRQSYLSETTTVTSPIRPPRRYPLPPGKLTIDVDAARAFQPGFPLPTVPEAPMRSPYGVVVPSPGPTYFPRYEPHSAVTQRATEH